MESSLVLRSPCALNVTQEKDLTHTGEWKLYKNEKIGLFWKLLLFDGPSRLSPEWIWGKFWVKLNLNLSTRFASLLISWVNQGVSLLLRHKEKKKNRWDGFRFWSWRKKLWTRWNSLCDGPLYVRMLQNKRRCVCVCVCHIVSSYECDHCCWPTTWTCGCYASQHH